MAGQDRLGSNVGIGCCPATIDRTRNGADASGACSAMLVVPVTNKTNAFGPLFADTSTLPQAATFHGFFPTQVASLSRARAATDVDMQTSDVFNTAQSQASGSTAFEMRYPDHFGSGPGALRTAIQAELILQDFLSSTPRPARAPKHPLSGSSSHG